MASSGSAQENVSLAELLQHAAQDSPGRSVMEARVALTAAGLAGTDRILPENPTLSLGAGARHGGGDAGLELEVGLDQRFELGGQARLRRQVATSALEVARHEQVLEAWELAAQVRELFTEALIAREELALAVRSEGFASGVRDVAERLVEAGEEAPLILIVAEVDLADARERGVAARGRYREALVRLALTAGWSPERLQGVAGELPAELPEGLAGERQVNALLERLDQGHPLVQIREAERRHGQQAVDLADRDGRISPTFGVSWGREAGLSGEPSANIWMARVELPLPFAQRNQLEREVARATLDLGEQERSLEAHLLRLQFAVGLVALEAANERLRIYGEGIVQRLELGLSLLQRAYELGEIDLNTVLQMRQRLLDAHEHYLGARADLARSLTHLEGLLGMSLSGGLEEL